MFDNLTVEQRLSLCDVLYSAMRKTSKLARYLIHDVGVHDWKALQALARENDTHAELYGLYMEAGERIYGPPRA